MGHESCYAPDNIKGDVSPDEKRNTERVMFPFHDPTNTVVFLDLHVGIGTQYTLR